VCSSDLVFPPISVMPFSTAGPPSPGLKRSSSSGEVIFSEELLLFKPGEGGPAVEKGITEIGGKTPINPDGGIISKGEPVGASALGQIVELTYQLRGTAGPRQIAGAKVGLAHVKGAMGHSCVTICTV
jgi:acetyl-CoA acetyltransferase